MSLEAGVCLGMVGMAFIAAYFAVNMRESLHLRMFATMITIGMFMGVFDVMRRLATTAGWAANTIAQITNFMHIFIAIFLLGMLLLFIYAIKFALEMFSSPKKSFRLGR